MEPRSVFAVVCVVLLLPLWCFPFVPTQDGPSHLYNAYVLGNFYDPFYAAYYKVNWRAFPNWTTYVVLVPLLKIFPVLIAEKLFLSLYVLLFVGCVGYFVRAFQPRASPLVLFFPGACFVYNFFFFMGFYNFVLSVSLFFGMVGYWWKHRYRLTLPRLLWLYALISLTYFTHLFSYGLFFCAVAILSLTSWMGRWRLLLRTFVSLLPGCLYLLFYLPNSDVLRSSKQGVKLPKMNVYLPTLKHLFATLNDSLYNVMVSLHPAQKKLMIWVVVLACVLLVYTLWSRLYVLVWKREKSFLEAKDALIPLFAFFVALYLFLPYSIGTGGWVNLRMALFVWPIVFAWLTSPRQPWQRWLHMGYTSSLLLAVVGILVFSFAQTNESLRAFTAPMKLVKKNAVVLPASYSKFERSHRVGIMFHAHSYYSIERHSVSLGNYEAVLDYFPINFRPKLHAEYRYSCRALWMYPSIVNILENKIDHFDLCRLARTVDYVLLWKNDRMSSRTRRELHRCYTTVHKKNKVYLYKSKTKRRTP